REPPTTTTSSIPWKVSSMSEITCWAVPQEGKPRRTIMPARIILYTRFIARRVWWIGTASVWLGSWVRISGFYINTQAVGHHGKRFVGYLHIVFIGQAFIVD